MDFDLNKPQKLLRTSARTLLKRACPPDRIRQLIETPTGSDEALWQVLADQGWPGLLLPDEYGGLALGPIELIVVCEEMGRACLPGPFLGTLWAASLINDAGTDEQRARWLPRLAAGEIKATVALGEPGLIGWSLAPVCMIATPEPDGWRLTGTKVVVLDLGAADLIVVATRGPDGPLLAVLPVTATGVTLTATPGMDSTRKLGRLDLDRVRVPRGDTLGGDRVAEGFARAMAVATLAATAELVGVMEWALEVSVEYAKTRQQFGRPIGTYQAVQHKCADMLLWVESSRSAVYQAAWAVSSASDQEAFAVSVAKAYCSDAAREVMNRAVQVHGGIGFTWDHDLHLYYKRATSNALLFGDATHHRDVVARLMLDEAQAPRARDLAATAVPAEATRGRT